MISSKKGKIILFHFLFFFTQLTYGQLSSFTLNVTSTHETCSGNGSISINVSGTTSGSTVLFEIYKYPNLTSPIIIISSPILNGLSSGNYKVKAIQSLGLNSNYEEQDVVILDNTVVLDFEIIGNTLSCGIDATISIDMLNGNAVSFEIFSGPIIKPLQTSNVFNGLIAGEYFIRVFDSCGDGYVKNFTIYFVNSGTFSIVTINDSTSEDCLTIPIAISLLPTTSIPIALPLSVQYKVYNPFSGIPIIINQIISSGSYFFQSIPLFPNQFYTYDVVITDNCGSVFNSVGNVANSSTQPTLLIQSINCEIGSYSFVNATSVVVINAPSSYDFTLPHSITESSIENTFALENFENGYYVFQVTDVCGISHDLYYNLSIYNGQEFDVFQLKDCNIGYGSFRIYSNLLEMENVFIVQAPPTYENTLPHNVSENIVPLKHYFYMNSLIEGFYNFKIVDVCGNESYIEQYIDGYHYDSDITVSRNCNTFDINLFYYSNAVYEQYFLQRYDTVLDKWVHPTSGSFVISSDTPNGINSILLNNFYVNYNFFVDGDYRIVQRRFSYGNGTNEYENCYNTIYTFDYFSDPKINGVYSFECSDNSYNVIVDALGIGTIQYRITTKNGEPFFVDNGTNPFFYGLTTGNYNFQIEDNCGNILNIEFDVPTNFDFTISSFNLCENQNAVLSVPNFPFLNYTWWKDDNEANIISTTNSLQLDNFNFAEFGGIYHLQIDYNSNNNSCINFQLEYAIPSIQIIPNAGIDGTISYCGNQGSIDLFSLLSGTFDTLGTWTEVTSSGTLVNNLWNSSSVIPGNYQFKYRVEGLCDAFDESFVNIAINEIPQSPIPTVDAVICDGSSLQLYASTIPNVTYEWVGPNGFASNIQNPIINGVSSLNNGTYFVKALTTSCESTISSVDVLTSTLPQFSLDFDCIENIATLTATILNNSFDASNSVYNWTNSDGFSSSENPINITGEEKGIYSLTVTNNLGCSATETIEVKTTLCKIPKGISPNTDGDNDDFDLSGFDGVQKVKIFNRYGMTVFEQDNYINQWEGQDKNGNILPSGTYYYLVTFANGEPKTGWVYLSLD